jgi:hypothetical protein
MRCVCCNACDDDDDGDDEKEEEEEENGSGGGNRQCQLRTAIRRQQRLKAEVNKGLRFCFSCVHLQRKGQAAVGGDNFGNV